MIVMLCEKCKKRTATVFYNENINGKTRSYSLCAECAAKMRDVLSRWAETENVPMKILGPVSAKILKVNNRYR